jgi:SNF2 family DNA or RNA helicase
VVSLWAHQRAVLTDLAIGHYLLLWEPGVGKTAALVVAGGIVGGRQLWLSPAVIIPQSIEEIRRWRPGVKIQHIRTGRDRLDRSADVVILSYDLMRRVEIWRQLISVTWASAVADEGHAFGHSSAVRTRAFYGARADSPGALFRHCERVWIATGTPVLNHPDELHGHLSRLMPRLIPGLLRKQDFTDHYCVTINKSFGPVVVGARNLPELRRVLAVCASRLTLADVTDLPALLVDQIPVEISARDRAAIEATMTEDQRHELHVVVTQIEGGDESKWQRLQAMLLPLASTRRVTAMAKAQACVDLVRSELDGGADRIVVFGVHVEALKFVAEACARHEARLLNGSTSPADRERHLRAFTSGHARVLVASSRVAGYGLNLQAARRALFLETDWTPAGVDQAIARLYRAGQQRPVHVSMLAVANSIDGRVAEVIRRKRTTIDQLLGEAA